MEGSLDISEDGQVFYLLFFSIKAFDYLGEVKIISPISTRLCEGWLKTQEM